MTLYLFQGMSFNPDTRELTGAEGTTEIKPKNAEVLAYLLQHRDRVVNRDELLETIWKDVHVADQSLTKAVTELRTALGDRARNSLYIKTVLKKGYKWVCEETREEHPAPLPSPQPAPAPARQAILPQAAPKPRLPWIAATVVVLLSLSAWQVMKTADVGDEQTETSLYLPRLAVLPFSNRTGDAEKNWIEMGLRDLVCQNLNRLGYFDLVPLNDLVRTLDREGLPEIGLDTDLSRISKNLDFRYLIATDAHLTEDGAWRLQLRILDARGGEETHSVSGSALAEVARHAGYALAGKTGYPMDAPSSSPGTDEFTSQSYAKGMQFLENREYEKAANHFRVTLDNDPAMTWAKFQLARARQYTEEQDESQALFADVIEQARATGNPIMEAEALRYQGLIHRKSARWEEAVRYSQEALAIYRNLDHLSGIILSQNQLATVNAQKGELDQAGALLQDSLSLLPLLGNRYVESQTLIKHGTVLSMRGKTAEARAPFERALALFRELGDARNEAAVLNNLGNIANLHRDYAEAAEIYEKTLALRQKLGNKPGEARTLLNLGLIAVVGGQIPLAYERFNAALTISREVNNEFLECHALNGMGRWALMARENDRARTWFETARETATRIGARSLHTESVCLLAHLALVENRPDKAAELLAGLNSEKEPRRPVYLTTMASVVYAQGRFKEALEFQTQARERAGPRWGERDEAVLNTYAYAAEVNQSRPLPGNAVYLPIF
ncbi:MAG: tetratricopeptide repeat protein [Acidobacteriota bacterium]|nr:tetratricopeptide repeat protein [Acidobacteriota bacterium]